MNQRPCSKPRIPAIIYDIHLIRQYAINVGAMHSYSCCLSVKHLHLTAYQPVTTMSVVPWLVLCRMLIRSPTLFLRKLIGWFMQCFVRVLLPFLFVVYIRAYWSAYAKSDLVSSHTRETDKCLNSIYLFVCNRMCSLQLVFSKEYF